MTDAVLVALVGAIAVALGSATTFAGSVLAPQITARADAKRRAEECAAVEVVRRRAALRQALKDLSAAAAAAALSAGDSGIPTGDASLRLASVQAELELELLPGEEQLAAALALGVLVMNGPLPGGQQGLLVGSITKALAKWHSGRATLDETVLQIEQTHRLWKGSHSAGPES